MTTPGPRSSSFSTAPTICSPRMPRASARSLGGREIGPETLLASRLPAKLTLAGTERRWRHIGTLGEVRLVPVSVGRPVRHAVELAAVREVRG